MHIGATASTVSLAASVGLVSCLDSRSRGWSFSFVLSCIVTRLLSRLSALSGSPPFSQPFLFATSLPRFGLRLFGLGARPSLGPLGLGFGRLLPRPFSGPLPSPGPCPLLPGPPWPTGNISAPLPLLFCVCGPPCLLSGLSVSARARCVSPWPTLAFAWPLLGGLLVFGTSLAFRPPATLLRCFALVLAAVFLFFLTSLCASLEAGRKLGAISVPWSSDCPVPSVCDACPSCHCAIACALVLLSRSAASHLLLHAHSSKPPS